jgi:sigma-B regulation protein RsbU (phosphoserine phosphatase)
VTDNEKIIPVISERLQAHGLNPLVLSHSNDLLNTLQAHTGMDALLFDLEDPGRNHFAVITKLHEQYPLLKVVVLSSHCDPSQVRAAMNNGVFDFLPKPLDIRDLDLTIQRTVVAAKVLQKNVTDYEELLSIEHELDVAREIQSSIIPTNKTVHSEYGFEISGRNQAAQKVGGDFFDYFTLDENRLGFVIGDVSSKGIPAAIFMAISRTLFKTIALSGGDPAYCLKELNRILAIESDPAMFIAIFYGILDVVSGEIAYANGGHTHPILVRSDGPMQILDNTGGLVLGVVEDAEYDLFHEKLSSGDLFFVATDGFSELNDIHGKPVSDHFLKRNLIRYRQETPNQILDKIYHSVRQIHPDNQSLSDDITCLLLKYQGEL